eukprot:Nitzschia sp. Nitz4//scaffold123_size70294//29433//30512//NITZ4_005925-RA/size70294-processed-gene-0.22-mRNA-1//-1//CDS//3329534476//8365//frame0
MKTIAIPRVYLGTMSFGWSQNSRVVDQPIATEMVRRLIQFDEELGVACHYVDTARLYAGGKSETMLGVSLGQIDGTLPSDSKLMIGTKAHPAVLKDKGLSPDGIRVQLQASLDAMNLSSVDEFYLHQPDTERDLLESLRCTHSLVQEGKIRIVGMSNYHASEVARAFDLCKTHNLTPPTVYQGLYNPLNRLVEKELLPLLKENNCAFVAYNPLAAGLLTGKHTSVDEVAKGRFKNNKNYLERFYTPSNFEAIGLIQAQCEADGISMVEATYRWILRHSDLDAGRDGVLLGASSLEQLDQNLEACKAAVDKDPLSPAMLEAFDKAWELTKVGAFPYWRSYSADMPGRESLDSGASYEAKK